MVSVPQFPPIPRLSIVVPLSRCDTGRDLATFENTLISVLEHQPAGSEILVCHDGRYDDPFALSDEVRFVVGDSDRFVPLVAVGVRAARGRFVHILADGLRATNGWTDEALEKFEHFDAAAVTPVIRDSETREILAAGWYDGNDRLCKPAFHGQTDAGTSRPKLVGAYLQASFWRRDVIRSLGEAFATNDPLLATYGYEYLIRRAGWRCVMAATSNVLCDSGVVPGDESSLVRGRQLRAIRNQFVHGGWSRSCVASVSAALANVIRPSLLAESLGQALAPLATAKLSTQIQPDHVVACERGDKFMTLPAGRSGVSFRRAA